MDGDKGSLRFSRVRLAGLFTFDIGRLKGSEAVLQTLRSNAAFEKCEYLQLNERFFDQAASKPLIMVKEEESELLEVVPDWGRVPEKYRVEVEEACDLLRGSLLDIRWFVSSTGVGALFYDSVLEQDVHTAEVIAATNALVKYRADLRLASGAALNVRDRIVAFRRMLSSCVIQERSDYVREYSRINVVQVAPSVWEECNRMGLPIYLAHESEWHALSVRTIEEWRERFPRGSTFREPNRAISPVGVLKINMRNAVVYEHPYSEQELADLYDPVFVETRIWDMLLAAELQYIQNYIAAYEAGSVIDVPAGRLEALRQIGLRTVNEFDGFQLSTSKRTRNLYAVAREAFEIPAMVGLFEKKLAYLDRLLDSARAYKQEEDDLAGARQQQELMERAYGSAEEEGATRLLLSIIGVATGLTLALNIVEAFELPQAWNVSLLIVFGILYSVIYAIARLVPKKRPVSSVGQWLFSTRLSAAGIVEALSSGAGERVVEAAVLGNAKGFVSFDESSVGCKARVRVTVTVRESGVSGRPNGLMDLEVVVLNRKVTRWLGRNVVRWAAERVVALTEGQIELGNEMKDALE